MNRSGGGYKVATAASSDTERVATGSSRSIGKMKVLGWDEDSGPVRATPVDQHMDCPLKNPDERLMLTQPANSTISTVLYDSSRRVK